jgi:hypothetical protein
MNWHNNEYKTKLLNTSRVPARCGDGYPLAIFSCNAMLCGHIFLTINLQITIILGFDQLENHLHKLDICYILHFIKHKTFLFSKIELSHHIYGKFCQYAFMETNVFD